MTHRLHQMYHFKHQKKTFRTVNHKYIESFTYTQHGLCVGSAPDSVKQGHTDVDKALKGHVTENRMKTCRVLNYIKFHQFSRHERLLYKKEINRGFFNHELCV